MKKNIGLYGDIRQTSNYGTFYVLMCISALFLGLMSVSASADDQARKDEARTILQKFLTPGTDLFALTKSIIPTEADIRSVYKDPLAGKLIKHYSEMFNSAGALTAGEGNNNYSILFSNTSDLIAGTEAEMDKFPGGYAQVTQYMNSGFPIASFQFVKNNDRLGMAYDGLIYVNGRWVIMPKPWRVLKK